MIIAGFSCPPSGFIHISTVNGWIGESYDAVWYRGLRRKPSWRPEKYTAVSDFRKSFGDEGVCVSLGCLEKWCDFSLVLEFTVQDGAVLADAFLTTLCAIFNWRQFEKWSKNINESTKWRNVTFVNSMICVVAWFLYSTLLWRRRVVINDWKHVVQTSPNLLA